MGWALYGNSKKAKSVCIIEENFFFLSQDGEEVYSEYVKEDLIKVLENFLGKQAHTDENANKKK